MRNSSCGKVMFSQACGCPRGRGGHHAWQREGACVVKGGRVNGKKGAYVARETATAADGTHPTGMHSYFQCKHETLDSCNRTILLFSKQNQWRGYRSSSLLNKYIYLRK